MVVCRAARPTLPAWLVVRHRRLFTDLSDVLDRLVTFADPVIIAGDVNIRLNRVDESPARRFHELVADYGV